MSLTTVTMKRLYRSAEDGDVEALYSILADADTPLHIAASKGNTHYAMEIATLKPSLAKKLNRQGFSPMHVALQKGHKQEARALLTFDRELVRVKGKWGITPLHYVAQMEDLDLLAEFLSACPSSIEDLTVQCETAVHVAVKNKNIKAVEVLKGWLLRVNKEEVLKWKDEDGNTVLHIATSTNQPKVMELVIRHVYVNAKNFDGLTAMDIFDHQGYSQEREALKEILGRAGGKTTSQLDKSATIFANYRKRVPFLPLDICATTFAGYLSRPLSLIEKRNKMLGISIISKKQSFLDVLLVVATLIATSTFQAVLNPPIQLWLEDTGLNKTINTEIFGMNVNTRKMMKIGRPIDLYIFFSLNTIAFFTSFAIIFTAIIDLPLTFSLFPSAVFFSLPTTTTKVTPFFIHQ